MIEKKKEKQRETEAQRKKSPDKILIKQDQNGKEIQLVNQSS